MADVAIAARAGLPLRSGAEDDLLPVHHRVKLARTAMPLRPALRRPQAQAVLSRLEQVRQVIHDGEGLHLRIGNRRCEHVVASLYAVSVKLEIAGGMHCHQRGLRFSG